MKFAQIGKTKLDRLKADLLWQQQWADTVMERMKQLGLTAHVGRVRVAGTDHPAENYGAFGLAIVPLRELASRIDVSHVQHNRQVELRPIGSGGWNTDGYGRSVVSHNGGGRHNNPPTSIIELTDAGIIYAATDLYIGRWRNDEPCVSFVRPEVEACEGIAAGVRLLRSLGVVGPLEVRAVLMGLKGAYLIPPNVFYWYDRDFRPLTENEVHTEPVTLGEEVVKPTMEEIAVAMKPAFTVVWREAGVTRDPCFNNEGKFAPRD